VDVALSVCGVKLNPDVQLDRLVTLTDGILGFDISENVDMIRRKLENSMNEVEAMCKVLEYLLAIPMDELYVDIAEVEEGFTEKVLNLIQEAETLSEEIPGEITASEILAQRYEKIKLFKPDSLGGQLAHAAEVEPLSLEALYGLNVGGLMRKDIETAVSDLFSLGALGFESLESVSKTVAECLDDLYPDTLQRAKAERVRLSLESEFSHVFGVGHEKV